MDPNDPKTLRAHRRIARAAARIAATPDGKILIAHLERVIGWDEAGPGNPAEESLQFWTGQRSVVKLVRDHVAKGKKLMANPNDKDEDDE